MTNTEILQTVKHSKTEVDDQINIITNLVKTSNDVNNIIVLKNDTVKKIDKLLKYEFDIIELNYNTKAVFKNKEYSLIQLLKLRKCYDLKIKLLYNLTSNTNVNSDNVELAKLVLSEFKEIMILKDELKELNILISSINQKK